MKEQMNQIDEHEKVPTKRREFLRNALHVGASIIAGSAFLGISEPLMASSVAVKKLSPAQTKKFHLRRVSKLQSAKRSLLEKVRRGNLSPQAKKSMQNLLQGKNLDNVVNNFRNLGGSSAIDITVTGDGTHSISVT